MRSTLFDIIVGIFIGIGACIAGIVWIFNKFTNVDYLRSKLACFIKDSITYLLYGYDPSYKKYSDYKRKRTDYTEYSRWRNENESEENG